MRKSLGLLVGIVAMATTPASATTFFGVDYVLTAAYTSADHHSAHFILNITGINGAADTEKGRFGVNDFAFTKPVGLVTGTSPGFVFQSGGLNSSGCNGSGNFFCFNGPTPGGPALAANSSLQITFDLILAAGKNFDNYNGDFKIDWVGTKNNYDLISKHLGVTGGFQPFIAETPIPGAAFLFASGLAGLGVLGWRKRKKVSPQTVAA